MPNENSNGTGDSDAKVRFKKLLKDLGIDVYGIDPIEDIEYYIDRPPGASRTPWLIPKHERAAARAKLLGSMNGWGALHFNETRMRFLVFRYSLCWPIFMPYAVRVDERDNILFGDDGLPQPLLLQDMADLLGQHKQHASRTAQILEEQSILRWEGKRCYFNPKLSSFRGCKEKSNKFVTFRLIFAFPT